MSDALDLFSGARGWDVAAEPLGWTTHGVETNEAARATAEAAGFKHYPELDVTKVHISPGEFDLHLASPPCQTYSMAGNGDGRRNMARVLEALRAPEYLDSADERTGLVLHPLRIALEGLPRVMAWEQVPAVLPVWEACAAVLQEHGYSVVTAILNAERYGVPQTRRRAVLVARRDGIPARLPEITHSRFWNRSPERLDSGVEKWVSMAEALGWGMTQRPSMTVCGGGTDTGGAEPFGNGARAGIRREMEAGHWALRNNNTEHAAVRPIEQPAPTLYFGARSNSVGWVMRANAQANSAVRPIEQPAPTITGGHDTGDRVWQRSNYSAGSTSVGATSEERGRTIRHPEQPSVLITGKSFQWESSAQRIRVTPEEAAALQTFPDGYPFRGNKGQRFQQIGNAVPPLLAHAILASLAQS